MEYVEAAQKLIAKSEKRFKHVFTKLQLGHMVLERMGVWAVLGLGRARHAFGCTDYHRVILLDLDLLITDNVDELKVGAFKSPVATPPIMAFP